MADRVELRALAAGTDAELDAARTFLARTGAASARPRRDVVADVAHLALPVDVRRRGPLGLGSGPAAGLVTSCSAFAFRGLRACAFALESAGLPAPVCAGVSVV